MTLRELHLFAGAGGGLLASVMLGHRPVCAVEIDPYCRRVLQARRDEGWLPAELEVHDDVCTFDGRPWQGRVDLVAGGFPCQDLSVAGKGAGLEGARSGLFFELLRIVREVRPKWVYLENVPAITSRGLDRVLGALAELGFDAEWCVLSAADAGAPHLRKRWWCLARLADARSGASEQRRPLEVLGRRKDEAEQVGMGGGDVSDADEGQHDGAESALRAGRDAADDGRADVPDATGWRCASDEQPSSSGSPTGRGEADAVAGGCDVPDTARRQGDGRGRGELACEAGAWRRGDAAAVAGGAHDPDADGRRQQVGGSSELHGGGHAPRCDAYGLREADAADADDAGCKEQRLAVAAPEKCAAAECSRGRATERRLGGTADGLAEWLDQTASGYWAGEWETQPRLAQGQDHRVARLRALGNGQVPQTAAMAFLNLMQRYHQRGEA